MEIAERQKLVKKLAIIVIPVLLLTVGYFKFFYKGGEDVTPIAEDTSAVLDMPLDAKNVNREASSKWDSYSMEDSINRQKLNDKHISSQINIDDFLNEAEKPVEQVQVASIEPSESIEFEEPPKKIKKSRNSSISSAPSIPKKSSSNKIGFSDEQKQAMFGEPEKKVEEKKEPEPQIEKRKSFYSSSNEVSKSSNVVSDEYLPVVVHNDQVVKNGSTVRLRTTKACILNGVEIPKNTYISGLASLQSERVMISVKSLKMSDEIIQTKLSAFEEDGIEGIYVPGGINQEMANQSAQDAVGKVGATVSVPMFGSISVGGKKKIADPTVKIISGYKLLLKNANN